MTFNIDVVGMGSYGSCLMPVLCKIHHMARRANPHIDSNGLNVTAYDPAKVSNTDIGRQSFYTPDVGTNKAEVMVRRCRDNMLEHTARWTWSKNKWTGSPAHFVFVMLPTGKDREKIRHCLRDDQYVIDVGYEGRFAHVMIGGKEFGDLYGDNPSILQTTLPSGTSRDDPFLPITASAYAGSVMWELIKYGVIDPVDQYPCRGYFINNKSNTIEPISGADDLSQWAHEHDCR